MPPTRWAAFSCVLVDTLNSGGTKRVTTLNMANNLFDNLSPSLKSAAGLFAAAGLNLNEMIAKGDVNALKAHIESIKSGGDVAAAVTEATKTLQAQIETLAADKGTLSASLNTVHARLESIGIKSVDVSDEAKFKAAYQAAVTAQARTFLAKNGHSPIEDDPKADATKTGVKQTKTLAEFRALAPADKAAFTTLCRQGKAEITQMPQVGPA